ncbi:MAG TPA: fibrobacter succinogenes major paralogous domain-containing protein [Ignavibacteria bacterium]
MKQSYKVLYALLFIAIILPLGVNKSISQVTDVDSNTYKTVIIGNQIWMAENLNVDHYRNGDIIPQVQDSAEWVIFKTGAWCYYDNDPRIGETAAGKLYNWYAVKDPRGLAPEGWHIPDEDEWKELEDTLGGYLVAGKKLIVYSNWSFVDSYFSENTLSYFNAIPGGCRLENGKFESGGYVAYFWTSSDKFDNPWARRISLKESDVFRNIFSDDRGMSVRCISDSKVNEGEVFKNQYYFNEHSEFNKFWEDFKTAVKSEDKDAVLKMTIIPFKDEQNDVYGSENSVTSDTRKEFMENYDKIFNDVVKETIYSAKFQTFGKWEYEDYPVEAPGLYKIDEEWYLLYISYEKTDNDLSRPSLIIFGKENGIFKMSDIPYQE